MLDHLVYATPDLARTVTDLRSRGLQLGEGGPHPGYGTRNYLAGLGDGVFFEVIGPDPEQPEPEAGRPFGLDSLTEPRLVAYAIQVPDLDKTLASARAAGYRDLPAPREMSRRRPDGELLAWRITFPVMTERVAVVPFVIEWGSTPHPSGSAVKGARLVSLRGEHPEPERVAPHIAALGADLDLRAGPEPVLEAVIGTPAGELVLR